MAPPKVAAAIFALLALIDLFADTLLDPNLVTVVKAACRLGEAITVYLVAQGVIVKVGAR